MNVQVVPLPSFAPTAIPASARAEAARMILPPARRTSSPPPRPDYRLRRARSQSDLRSAQFLRFLVFNVELAEGLDQSYDTCLDADRFDTVCDHLLVESVATGETVGTYRLQTGAMAAANHGYYSAQEFDFKPYESLRSSLLELGRACILAPHRNFTVLSLLWRGIAEYAREHRGRYLIGCSSLTTQDPAVGATAYRQLHSHLVNPELRTEPMPSWKCPLDRVNDTELKLPKLLTTYLSLGARVCGPPALDREFKTVDFLTLMDLASIPPRTAQRWFAPTPSAPTEPG